MYWADPRLPSHSSNPTDLLNETTKSAMLKSRAEWASLCGIHCEKRLSGSWCQIGHSTSKSSLCCPLLAELLPLTQFKSQAGYTQTWASSSGPFYYEFLLMLMAFKMGWTNWSCDGHTWRHTTSLLLSPLSLTLSHTLTHIHTQIYQGGMTLAFQSSRKMWSWLWFGARFGLMLCSLCATGECWA